MTNVLPAGGRIGELSSDARAILHYHANRTEPLVAYVLLFTLGLFGAHNFYLNRTGIAIAQLILTVTLIGLLVTLVWVLVDAFLIPEIVRVRNTTLAERLGA